MANSDTNKTIKNITVVHDYANVYRVTIKTEDKKPLILIVFAKNLHNAFEKLKMLNYNVYRVIDSHYLYKGYVFHWAAGEKIENKQLFLVQKQKNLDYYYIYARADILAEMCDELNWMKRYVEPDNQSFKVIV